MADLDALVASPWWRWMPGMLTADGERIVRSNRNPRVFNTMSVTVDGERGRLRSRLPDPTDPATLGCLLALARGAWADPELLVRREIGGPNWVVIRSHSTQPFRGDTEADALIAAILAAPTPGVSRG